MQGTHKKTHSNIVARQKAARDRLDIAKLAWSAYICIMPQDTSSLFSLEQ
jgi:hypothetical protein